MIANEALFKIQYGLYVLSSVNKDGQDNGCIINTLMQVTVNPLTLVIGLNKSNYSYENIMATKKVCLSVLSEDVPFAVFKQFGYQSGRDVKKFVGVTSKKAENGLLYLPEYSNSYLSGSVIETYDFETHVLFKVLLEEAEVLNNKTSVTYEYYQKHIKEVQATTVTKGWRCKICGYIYEGDPLPEDFICPICKHGAIDFEKL